MDAGVNTLLVHEMIGVGGQEEHFGCEFNDFFRSEPDGTPGDLLQRGIYSSIAVAMKGGAWRETSMVMLAQVVAASSKDDEARASEDKGSKLSQKKVARIARLRCELSRLRSTRRSTKAAQPSPALVSTQIEQQAVDTRNGTELSTPCQRLHDFRQERLERASEQLYRDFRI